MKKLRCNQALVTTAARVCHQGSLRWRKKEQRANKPWSHQRNSASQLRGAFSARRRRNVTRRGVAAHLKSAGTQLSASAHRNAKLDFSFGREDVFREKRACLRLPPFLLGSSYEGETWSFSSYSLQSISSALSSVSSQTLQTALACPSRSRTSAASPLRTDDVALAVLAAVLAVPRQEATMLALRGAAGRGFSSLSRSCHGTGCHPGSSVAGPLVFVERIGLT